MYTKAQIIIGRLIRIKGLRLFNQLKVRLGRSEPCASIKAPCTLCVSHALWHTQGPPTRAQKPCIAFVLQSQLGIQGCFLRYEGFRFDPFRFFSSDVECWSERLGEGHYGIGLLNLPPWMMWIKGEGSWTWEASSRYWILIWLLCLLLSYFSNCDL